MPKSRRSHSPTFKAEVALEALRGDRSVAELSAKYAVHQTLINKWKRTLSEQAASVFGRSGSVKETSDVDRLVDDLYKQIGRLKVKNDVLATRLRHQVEKGGHPFDGED